MVDVAQLVELRIVAPAVVGSNPIVHPSSCSSGEVIESGWQWGALNSMTPCSRLWRDSQGFDGVFRTEPIQSLLSDALDQIQERS